MIRLINIISISAVIVLFALNLLLYRNEGDSLADKVVALFGEPEPTNAVVPTNPTPVPIKAPAALNTARAYPTAYNENTALLEYETNNIEVFHRVRSSVVHVTNNRLRQNYFTLDITSVPQGTGTGIIWGNAGLILTNYHVVANAGQIIIKLTDQTTYEATIVGMEPGKDLAVLRIDAPPEKLIPIKTGDSSALEVGRKVLAIGNPFGLDYTLTVGVISALGREIKSPSNMTIAGVIQTDAAINPGNSGGPLLNSSGELIGINTQIVSLSGGNAGIGFAIPVNSVRQIMPMLIKFGKIVRPYMGITLLDDSTSRYYDIEGAVIRRVSKNSPAHRAGLMGIQMTTSGFYLGDVIMEFDGVKVESVETLFLTLEKHKENDTVPIKVSRNGAIRRVKIVLDSPR